ncbi:carbohydrate ABC transporter permease [Amphibacillus cookii]|uniref:carbohydrate ABC transporter permease n=1 Tax=Amphibacillus cookii TaxID=767787 RepID=UPI00195BD383|nr:carbohydrate ABC transporter permease [Amphibacillus cookii]MBM7540303.1 ABC-type glycerol-3-phosphate transport system permease component [Amphibacillus cookii]
MAQQVMLENKKSLMVRILPKVIKYFFVWGFFLINFGLFFWILMTAFKDNREIFASPFGFPESYSFENFLRVLTEGNMALYLWNSFLVTMITIVFCLTLSATMSYVLSRFQFKGRQFLYILFVIGITLPLQSLIFPMFFRMHELGLRDSLLGIIIVYTALNLPRSVFLLVGYMKSIPREMEESALMDGCNYWQIFMKIILPLSKPMLATTGILIFLSTWNEYVFATVLLSSDANATLPLGLANFQTAYTSQYGLVSAGIIISIIPILIVYIIFQEQVVKGMVSGAVKG